MILIKAIFDLYYLPMPQPQFLPNPQFCIIIYYTTILSLYVFTKTPSF
jgi:hypothetical protein